MSLPTHAAVHRPVTVWQGKGSDKFLLGHVFQGKQEQCFKLVLQCLDNQNFLSTRVPVASNLVLISQYFCGIARRTLHLRLKLKGPWAYVGASALWFTWILLPYTSGKSWRSCATNPWAAAVYPATLAADAFRRVHTTPPFPTVTASDWTNFPAFPVCLNINQ